MHLEHHVDEAVAGALVGRAVVDLCVLGEHGLAERVVDAVERAGVNVVLVTDCVFFYEFFKFSHGFFLLSMSSLLVSFAYLRQRRHICAMSASSSAFLPVCVMICMPPICAVQLASTMHQP